MAQKMVRLHCAQCGNPFERGAGEVNRNQRLGRRPFCSRRCCGIASVENLPDDPSQFYPIRDHAANKRDDLSPFRWHLRRIRQHCEMRKQPNACQVTVEDLRDQWESQRGICPYTGWQLRQCASTNQSDQLALTPDRASVDRIDASGSYVLGNIEFVAFIAQMAKHLFKREDVIDFCRAVTRRFPEA